MRTAPPLSRALAFPVVTGIAAMAAMVTIATKTGRSLDPFTMSSAAFDSEPWRLAISALPHGDAIHILFNVYWLWILGTHLEEVLGHVTTFAIVIVLAVGSAAAQFALASGGIGLSGVGYGLVGFLWVTSKLDRRFRDGMEPRVLTLFGVWFVFCVITTMLDIWNIGNVAHGSGFVLGALIGGGLAPGARRRRAIAGAALVVVLAASLAGAALWRAHINLSATADQDDAYRGWKALDERRYADAIPYLERALRLSPEKADNWVNYAVALSNVPAHRGLDGVTPLAAYQRALALSPGDAATRGAVAREQARLGYLAQERGDHAAAIPLYTESLATQETAFALWNLGTAYVETGNRAEGERAFARAAALDPDFARRLADRLETVETNDAAPPDAAEAEPPSATPP